jgi:hypothetical protein
MVLYEDGEFKAAPRESKRSVISTESGYKLTTEGGDLLRNYTARAEP